MLTLTPYSFLLPREYTTMALAASGPTSMNPFMATGGPLSVSAGRLSFTYGFKVCARLCMSSGVFLIPRWLRRGDRAVIN